MRAFRPVFHALLVLGFYAEYGYQLLVKSNLKNGGRSAMYSMFLLVLEI